MRALLVGGVPGAGKTTIARTRVPDEDLLAMSLHRERGPMVMDDLRALPPAPLVIAEGTAVPAAGVGDPARAHAPGTSVARAGEYTGHDHG